MVNASELTLEQIREIGLRSLLRDLGTVGLIRFLQQFETGSGDYTRERHAWLGNLSLDELVKSMRAQRATPPVEASGEE
jgi:hypothetical protein